MPTPLSPAPVKGRAVGALPPYVSNGLVGMRCPGVPNVRGTTIVGGFAGLDPSDGVEGFTRAPYAVATDVQLDGVWASMAPEWIRILEQRYDFASGELLTTWQFAVEGTTATVETLVFCPRSIPTIVACEVTVRLDRPADLAIAAGLDPSDVPGFADARAQPQDQGPNEGVDGRLRWHSRGDIATLGIAYSTSLEGDAGAERKAKRATNGAGSRPHTTCGRDRVADIASACSRRSFPDLSHARPDEQAGRIAAVGAERGFDRLRRENRDIWTEAWRGRIEIDGADRRWQAITDASLFYLLSSVHASSLASTSLFGLAYWPNYHYYHGHVMWDIETFTVPPLLLLDPGAAHALLDYRSRHLRRHTTTLRCTDGAEPCTRGRAARSTARRRPRGPARTPRITSAPTSRSPSPATCMRPATSTTPAGSRGPSFEPSPIGSRRASYVPTRGFEIRDTVGPREHYERVDNDAFTNMAAAQALREATACARLLDERRAAGVAGDR